MDNGILLGRGDEPIILRADKANRHGLITGATGTGKTVTMQVLLEGFSRMGVPVIAPDIKGDLTGMAHPGKDHPEVSRRIDALGIEDFAFEAFPLRRWDALGKDGIPLRTTITELGPLLLGRLLGLSPVQQAVIELVFRIADDEHLLLIDLKDVLAVIDAISREPEAYAAHGELSSRSLGVIRRELTRLQGDADAFFGEPAMELADFMDIVDGKGAINILVADDLIEKPAVYSAVLLWLLSELFEELPEVGNPDKPVLALFLDEAHLFFTDATPEVQRRLEQVVRLIRSKGVAVFFITQSPADLSEGVLRQLGNKVQHALRAYTPREQQAIRSVEQGFRPNPDLDIQQAVQELGTGEAIISVLDAHGVPTVATRTLLPPPRSKIGAAPLEDESSAIAEKYRVSIDRESAHEILSARLEKPATKEKRKEPKKKESALSKDVKKELRTLARTATRELVRGIFGTLKR